MAQPVIWHLFVDESGDFDRDTDKVAVAGIGLRLDRALGRPDEIRSNLERLVPGLAWPLHLCVLKRISALALAPLALRWRAVHTVAGQKRTAVIRILQSIETDTTPADDDVSRVRSQIEEVAQHGLAIPVMEAFVRHKNAWRRLVEALGSQKEVGVVPDEIATDFSIWEMPEKWAPAIRSAQYLFTQHPTAAATTVRALARGENPNYEDLQRLDHLLRGYSEARILSGQLVRILSAYRRILETLAQPDGSGWPGAFLCFAGESRPGDYTPPGDGSDRYLSLLEAMLSRVVEALSRWPGPHQVRLYVCGRRVLDPLIGRSRFLHIRDLGLLRGRILERLSASVVRMVPVEVPRYGDTRDPGFVLADFVASVACRAVGNRDLARVESRARQEGGIVPRSEGRTHVQAAGAAWVLLESLRQGKNPAPASEMWPWAREQALEWGSP